MAEKDKDKRTLSTSLDALSTYLAPRKGLIPIVGMGLIIINLIFQLFFLNSWIAQSNLFLHIGLLTSIFGLMLAWAL